MNASQLLEELTSAGIEIAAMNGKLRYSPKDSVTPDLRAELVSNKYELMETLRRAYAESVKAAREQFEKRAAIIEFDAKFNRQEAERLAAQGMPIDCPKCKTELIKSATFDEFINLDCPRCRACIGCLPRPKV